MAPAACLAVLAAAPSALAAGTVTVGVGGYVSFSAGVGDINDLMITTTPERITITDAGAVINEAEARCAGDNTNEVTCTDIGFSGFNVSLGDEDDVLVASGPVGGFVEGDEGDDTLTGSDTNALGETVLGGEGNDLLDTRNVGTPDPGTGPSADGAPPSTLAVGDAALGEAGNDTIRTGNGDDRAEGGDGVDSVTTGSGDDEATDGGSQADSYDLGPGDDTMVKRAGGSSNAFQGGPGIDVIAYVNTISGPPGTVFDSFALDLGAGTASQTAPLQATDSATGFEDVRTSRGSDSVVGTGGPNNIATGGGADTVSPLAGADHVDLLDGDDSADVRDGYYDRVLCGAGQDTVEADQLDELVACDAVSITDIRPAAADLDPPDCELTGVRRRYRRPGFLRGVRPRASCDEPAMVELRLVARVRRARGNRLVAAKAGDLVVAERSFGLSSATRRPRLRPPKRLRRALRRARRARVVLFAHDQFGNRSTAVRRFGIRRR